MFFPPGRKTSVMEKPLPPLEPVEPVLCGSMAIGAVSLAVARTSASLDSHPLYFSIASLKHQVSLRYIPSQVRSLGISVCMDHVPHFLLLWFCFRRNQQS